MTRTPCVDYVICDDCNGAGSVPDANFWCGPCKGEGTRPARLFHYEVLSPEMHSPGSSYPPEPPESWRCWRMVLAPNARTAVALAVKSEDFREWRTEARGDGCNPFAGVKAMRTLCEHGVCWGCYAPELDADEQEVECCDECEKLAPDDTLELMGAV